MQEMLLISLIFVLFILLNLILIKRLKGQTEGLIEEIKKSFFLQVIVFLKLLSRIINIFFKKA